MRHALTVSGLAAADTVMVGDRLHDVVGASRNGVFPVGVHVLGVGYHCPMPIVSTFFGIVIRMFYREHGPAHVHVEYQGEHASFTFDGNRLAGNMTFRRAMRLVKRWSLANRAELEANWAKAGTGQHLEQIAPLQ